MVPSSSPVNGRGVGHLVTYLGTAPGVGKTFRMLRDGRARAETGEDVVVGWVERHGRAATREQAQQLEIVPARVVAHRGVPFEDLDVSAVIERRPDVVLVDELAHTGVDGRARHQDVQDLLNAGIDVVTTVNAANLLSVRDVASAHHRRRRARGRARRRGACGRRRPGRSPARGIAASHCRWPGVFRRCGRRSSRQLLPAVESEASGQARPVVARRQRRGDLCVSRPRGP